jgi:hypothetical protein
VSLPLSLKNSLDHFPYTIRPLRVRIFLLGKLSILKQFLRLPGMFYPMGSLNMFVALRENMFLPYIVWALYSMLGI